MRTFFVPSLLLLWPGSSAVLAFALRDAKSDPVNMSLQRPCYLLYDSVFPLGGLAEVPFLLLAGSTWW